MTFDDGSTVTCRLQAKPLTFEVEPFSGNAERLRGGVHLPVVVAQRDLDHLELDAVERGLKLFANGRGADAARTRDWRRACVGDLGGEYVGREHSTGFCQGNHPADL